MDMKNSATKDCNGKDAHKMITNKLYNFSGKLKYFNSDRSRVSSLVCPEYYQMDMKSIVDRCLKESPEMFTNGTDSLPSWSKVVANPIKAKGFITWLVQALIEGKGNDDSLNVDLQTRRNINEGVKVSMMWLSGACTKKSAKEFASIVNNALPTGWIVEVITGDTTTNGKAESDCKKIIKTAKKENKNVLFISMGMAARSFSIPEITEIYLAYDAGDAGATAQKMSRALTPDKPGKIARIFSLSFDPNRDDKFDAMILEMAKNLNKKKDIGDLKESIRRVLKSIDIFSCQEDGSVRINVDEYLSRLLDRKDSLDRIIGIQIDLSTLNEDKISDLVKGVDVKSHLSDDSSKAEVAQSGKTYANDENNTKTKASNDKTVENDRQKLREMCMLVSKRFYMISYQCPEKLTIAEMFKRLAAKNQTERINISEMVGVKYDTIKFLVLNNVINRDLLSLKID